MPALEDSHSEMHAQVERSGYYLRLTVLWCIRLAAWVLGAYLIRIRFSLDSLKLYAAVSVLTAVAVNVLPEAGRRARTTAPSRPTPSAATTARWTHTGNANPAVASSSSSSVSAPATRTPTAAAPRTAALPSHAPRVTLIERARLGQMMRALGTPGAIRCVSDEAFRAVMLQRGCETAGNDPCPCGSGETFQRCCYAVPETLREWADSMAA